MNILGISPLKHPPHIFNPEQGESKRGEASLSIFLPLPYQGRGIKGEGYKINIKG